jgi:hypothetical protein
MKIKIEGYESMTNEEKLAALEAYEPDMSGYVSKDVFDKKASEAADLSKKLRERMSEEEAKAAKEAEEKADLIAKLEQLQYEKMVNIYVAQYVGMGYDEALAKSSAEALAKGDTDTVFKNQKAHVAAREKALKTELLKATPAPAAGGTPEGGMTKEAFSKLTLAEKAKFADENPEKYKEFYGGN